MKKMKLFLKALQPPTNLEEFGLDKYRGNTISPRWLKSLINLRMLILNDCVNCEHLPPWGNCHPLNHS